MPRTSLLVANYSADEATITAKCQFYTLYLAHMSPTYYGYYQHCRIICRISRHRLQELGPKVGWCCNFRFNIFKRVAATTTPHMNKHSNSQYHKHQHFLKCITKRTVHSCELAPPELIATTSNRLLCLYHAQQSELQSSEQYHHKDISTASKYRTNGTKFMFSQHILRQI